MTKDSPYIQFYHGRRDGVFHKDHWLAVFYPNDTIILNKKIYQENYNGIYSLERILNHEYLHWILYNLEGIKTSSAYDNMSDGCVHSIDDQYHETITSITDHYGEYW